MAVHSAFLIFQEMKYNLFKTQNPEIGRFDVIFEVKGKLLYAHKTMLNLVSDTFDSMLSDRWMKNKEKPIKIQDYSYQDFYQFLTFLYSAQCELTDSNIFAMVDIAEFYGVDLFKIYCETYLLYMEITAENVFSLMNLAKTFSLIEFQTRIIWFIRKNFSAIINSDGFLKVTKDVAKELVDTLKNNVEPEDLFQAVYKYSKKRAKKAKNANPNLNLNETIKTEFSDFLPFICFREMDLKFLHGFVVPRSFIFSSLNEFSKILCDRDCFFEGKVKITNKNGQTLHGNVIPDKNVLRKIESLKSSCASHLIDTYCYWNTPCQFPSTPSPLKKKDDVQWYLIYYSAAQIGIVNRIHIHKSHYILAELTAGTTGFQTAAGCKIELE